MKEKTIIEKAIALIAGVILVVLLSYLALEIVMPQEKEQIQQFSIGERPTPQKLDLTIPGEQSSIEEKIAFAASLYDIANQNYKNTEDVAMMVHSSTTMLGGLLAIPGYRYIVKNGAEYYYLEYSFIPQTGDALSAIIGFIAGKIEKESTQFALRKYYNESMDNIKVQRVVDPIPKLIYDEENNINFYDVDWTNIKEETEEIPVYYSGQIPPYEQTEQVINIETITSAEILYDEEEGFYTLVLELDPTLGAVKTRERLRASSGYNDAVYTKLIQTIEIWDNGFFRYFRAEDDWAGGGVSSEIDFRTYFYYDEFWTNPENYQHMKEAKEALSG